LQLNVSELLRALQIMERNVSVTLMYSGLRVPQFRLLEQITTQGSATVTDLSKALGITRATTSVQVNELLRSGIIAMEESEVDRRSFHLHLTELGANKLKVARSDLAVMQQKLERHFGPQLVECLNHFTREMGKHKSSSQMGNRS